MTLEQLSSDINQEIRAQLEKNHCVRGELRYQPLSSVSLKGIKEDDTPINIWQTNPRLGYLLWLYVDLLPNDGGVIIMVNLPDQFTYSSISNGVIEQDAKQIEQQRQAESLQAQREKLEALRLHTEKYGMAFAEQVANGLLKGGSIGYNHRDYCGMGLEYQDGVFTYGEVHDGYMTYHPNSKRSWSSKESFVEWLAEQSDASLARFEEKDSWYWGNQTIDRKRLLVLAIKGERKG